MICPMANSEFCIWECKEEECAWRNEYFARCAITIDAYQKWLEAKEESWKAGIEMEAVISLESGQDVSYCPYCHSTDVRPCEVAGLWSCENCHKDFIVYHRKAKPKPKVKAISADDLWTKMKKAGIA